MSSKVRYSFERFLLRYSTTASSLRTELGRLKYFNATPEEFRALFRASDKINQQLQAGNYSVNFDAKQLSSGVYFGRIATKEGTRTVKFIVNK